MTNVVYLKILIDMFWKNISIKLVAELHTKKSCTMFLCVTIKARWANQFLTKLQRWKIRFCHVKAFLLQSFQPINIWDLIILFLSLMKIITSTIILLIMICCRKWNNRSKTTRTSKGSSSSKSLATMCWVLDIICTVKVFEGYRFIHLINKAVAQFWFFVLFVFSSFSLYFFATTLADRVSE